MTATPFAAAQAFTRRANRPANRVRCVLSRSSSEPPCGRRAAGRALLASGACRLAARHAAAHGRRRGFRQPAGPGPVDRAGWAFAPGRIPAVPAGPPAAGFGYGWTRRPCRPVLLPVPARSWPTRSWRRPGPHRAGDRAVVAGMGGAVGARPATASRLGCGMGCCRPSGDPALLVTGSALTAGRLTTSRPAHRGADHRSARPASSAGSESR
jgi:hypothetical protein